MAKKHIKRCSTSLMAIIKKNLQTINAEESVVKRELSYIVSGNVNLYSHSGEQYGGSLKN